MNTMTLPGGQRATPPGGQRVTLPGGERVNPWTARVDHLLSLQHYHLHDELGPRLLTLMGRRVMKSIEGQF